MEVGSQLHAPVAFLRVPFAQEAEWTPEPVRTRWWREKFLAPAGTRTTIIHPVAQIYYWAIPAPITDTIYIVE